MKASELVERVQELIRLHGDRDVLIDSGRELEQIGEVDVDVDDNGIVIWME